MSKTCGNCIWFTQGKNCCFCANPKQADESLATYSYYPFTCNLHEVGRFDHSRLINMGYKEKTRNIKHANGGESSWTYFELLTR